jgi:hypothetical protein
MELEALADKGDTVAVRRALFELVGQIRGETPSGSPPLRVVANRS